jgi:hypothetical protein
MGVTLIDYAVITFAHALAALVIVGLFWHQQRSTGRE